MMSSLPLGAGIGTREVTFAVEGLLFVLVVTAIVLNVRAAQRTGTNKNATSAAIYALFAILPLLAAAVITQLRLIDSPFYVAGPVAILSLVIAEFYAAIGIGEFNKFPKHWKRGRRRAQAVLVVPVVIALGLVAGVVAHSSGYPIFSGFVSGTAGKTLLDKARNFQIDAPPPWVQTDSRRLDPAASAAFGRQNPPMVASIVVQPLPAGSESPFETALDSLKSQILRSQNGEVATVEPQVENGLKGVRVESTFGTAPDRQFQIHYIVQDGRSFYQLHTRGAESARSEIAVEARKLSAGFRLLDPNPVVQAKPEKLAVSYASTKFGYSVDVTKTVWNREWTALAKEVPFADFGILNARGSAAFCVIPVWLGDDEVDLDIVCNALTMRLGIPFARDSLLSLRTVRQGPLRGQAFGAEASQGNTRLLYRMRVLRGRGFAYLLAAYMNKAVEASPEFLDLALNCVNFEGTAAEPTLSGERQRGTHSLVWNDIGNGLFRTGKHEAALGWFKRAFELENTNLSALVNYSEACLQLKRPADAVAMLDQHIGRFPGNHALTARRAAAQYQAGDTAGALKGYAAAFAAGLRDDSEVARYLSILVNEKRPADALAALDRYAEGHDSPELKKLRAQVVELSRGGAAK